jgi:hypothetical protein
MTLTALSEDAVQNWQPPIPARGFLGVIVTMAVSGSQRQSAAVSGSQRQSTTVNTAAVRVGARTLIPVNRSWGGRTWTFWPSGHRLHIRNGTSSSSWLFIAWDGTMTAEHTEGCG